MSNFLSVLCYTLFQVFLFAQQVAQTAPVSILQVADKATTVGVLGYVAWTLNRNIKENRKAYQDEEKAIRAEHREDQKENRQAIKELTQSFIELKQSVNKNQ